MGETNWAILRGARDDVVVVDADVVMVVDGANGLV